MRQLLLSYSLMLFALSAHSNRGCEFVYEEKVSNYPEKAINEIVAKEGKFAAQAELNGSRSKAFYCHNGSYYESKPRQLVESLSLASRDSWSPDNDLSEAPCDSRTLTIYPQLLVNLMNEKVTVVNSECFRQEVVIEVCVNANQSCNAAMNFPMGYKSKCTQKYLTQKVIKLSKDGKSILNDTVLLPSGCECRFLPAKIETAGD